MLHSQHVRDMLAARSANHDLSVSEERYRHAELVRLLGAGAVEPLDGSRITPSFVSRPMSRSYQVSSLMRRLARGNRTRTRALIDRDRREARFLRAISPPNSRQSHAWRRSGIGFDYRPVLLDNGQWGWQLRRPAQLS